MKTVAVGVFATLLCAPAGEAQAYTSDVDHKVIISRIVLSEIEGITETRVPSNVRTQAICVAVFPNVSPPDNAQQNSATFGIATCKEASAWCAPVFLRLVGPSHSMMAGGADIVLIGIGDRAREAMSQSRFSCEDSQARSGPVVTGYYKSTHMSTLEGGYLAYRVKDSHLFGLNPAGLQVTREDPAESLSRNPATLNMQTKTEPKALPSSAKDFLRTVAELFH